jgi:methionyl-tRNA synthetase
MKYITTPIYYVNDKPHIGHAYTSVICDFLARFYRMMKEDVFFTTGTDEHGQKIEKSAQAAGMAPIDFVNQVSKSFSDLNGPLSLTNDAFIRTTDPKHYQAVKAFFKKIQDNGYIYKGNYEGWYSIRDEAFYQESDLVDGLAPTGSTVEWVSEPSYFFKLSKFQDQLLKFYYDNPDIITPKSRWKEVVRFLESGLQDLSISRTSLSWGIPVPSDESHKIYVWMDALTNYISAIGYPHSFDSQLWSHSIHVIGKDILRFHAIYWPAFLMAADLNLPSNLAVHGWWTNEGQKISKSLGNTIDPIDLVSRYSTDSVRYFLLKGMTFGQDGDFSIELFKTKYHSDLCNRLGNLVQRVFKFIDHSLEGLIPKAHSIHHRHIISKLIQHVEHFDIHKYIEEVMILVDNANYYIDQEKPWELKKQNNPKLYTVIGNLCDIIKCIGLFLYPAIPNGMERLMIMLGIEDINFDRLELSLENKTLSNVQPLYMRWQTAS